MGPSLDPVNQGHPSTSGLIEAIYEGNMETTRGAARYFYVDVQDTARLHAAALLRPRMENERIFAYAAPYTWRDIQTTLAKLYPDRIFAPQMEASRLDRSDIELPAKAEDWLKEMGRTRWTSLEDSGLANTRDLA
ncbi:aldehyde reductase II [Metarhizium guizhouense ARSEF 977]|uniref:Aldehyde reductase II n=1 Tax=Metarhizium guizhouense (strain ARSEF 977) TaxID=1276136 RepID=A0A0B4GH75_METGA|nr:aldehyde reductase II [Metarhizium guizhouense ARSEF 977]